MLEDGWWAAEQDGTVNFRWSRQRSTLLVPLDHAADLTLQLRVKAFAYPSGPGQAVTVSVNGAAHGPVPVSGDWQDVRLQTRADEWRAGLNRVVLAFTWERAPAEVGAGTDARALSAAVDYLRVRDESAK
jgi:hypothetical protein